MTREPSMQKATAGLLAAILLSFVPCEASAELLDDMKKECEREAGFGPRAEDQGPSREIHVDCPDPIVKEKIKALIARLRGLKEAKEFHLRDLRIAECAEHKCNDKKWRAIGPWGNSLLGLATSFEGMPPWSGWASAGIDVISSPDVGTTWAGIGAQGLETDKASGFVGSQLWTESIDDAWRRSQDYLAATGDVAGAKKIFVDNAGKIPGTGIPITPEGVKTTAKWAGAIVSVYDFYEDTDELANAYVAWREAKRERKQIEREVKRIDAKVEEILKEIEQWREQCKPCEEGFKRDATGQCKNPCGPDFQFQCPAGQMCAGQCR